MESLKFKTEETQHNISITNGGTCASWIYKLSDGAFVSKNPLQKDESVTLLISGHGRLDMGFYQTDEHKLKISDYNKIQEIMTPCAQVKCEKEEKCFELRLKNEFETTFGNKTKSVTYDPSQKVWLCFNINYGSIKMKVINCLVTDFVSPNYGKNVFVGQIIRLKEDNPYSVFSLDRPLQIKEKVHLSLSPMAEENHVPKTYYVRLAVSSAKETKQQNWVQFDQKGTITLEMTAGGVKCEYTPFEGESKSSDIKNGTYVWFQLFRASLEIGEFPSISDVLPSAAIASPTFYSETESTCSNYCRVYDHQNSKDASSTRYDEIEESTESLQECIVQLKHNIQQSKKNLEGMERCLQELDKILFQNRPRPQQNVQSLLKEIHSKEGGLTTSSLERKQLIGNIRKIFFE